MEAMAVKEITYLIIGGGIAGTTAAETIRQHDAKGTIAIVSDEPHRLYSRLTLSKPNFFLEKIPFEHIWLKNESWYRENNITFFGGEKATQLDSSQKRIALGSGVELHYERLLLAIGGRARSWDRPGAEKSGIFYLRSLDDAKMVIAALKSARSTSRHGSGQTESGQALAPGPWPLAPGRAGGQAGRRAGGQALAGQARRGVAVGGGFISFEMCEMMRLSGFEVTLIIRKPYFWADLLDEPSGRMIETALERGGVKILRKTEVVEVAGRDAVEGIILRDGVKVPCEMVIVGIGMTCPLAWVDAAGIAVNQGIVVNEYLETNRPNVWAAGDAAEYTDCIVGERIQLGNWVNAQMQGKAVGFNMVSSFDKLRTRKKPFRMVSFYTTQGFGLKIAFVGSVQLGPDRRIITRGSPDINSYARLLVRGREIVGATLLNRTQELGIIAKLIDHNVDISGKERQLSDPSFDIAKLLS